MPPRYFYGRSVKSNQVRAASARNFRELVQAFIEGPQKLVKTYREYHTLDAKAKLDAKDTTYLVACTYKTSEAERTLNGNTADVCNLVFLDLDAKEGESPAKAFVENKALLYRRLPEFNFVAYRTASSTPQSPRMRVVVDADGIPRSSYPAAVRTIAQLLGVAYDPVSETVNQAMICPSLFADQDEDNDHPLFAQRDDGRSFTLDDIQEGTGDKPKRAIRLEPLDGDDDGLEYLRAPLSGITLERAKEALGHLDPTMPYPKWVEIAMALRHQFSKTDEEAQAAYEIFDEWSSGGESSYQGPDDTLDKWNEVEPTPRGRTPTTIRTLIHRAVEAGWDVGEVKQECIDSILDWIAHQAKTFHDFTHVALKKLAAVPLVTFSEEEVVMSAIVKGLFETRQEKTTKKALKDDLKKIVRAAEKAIDKARKAEAEKEGKEETRGPFKGWCYVTLDERFYRTISHQSFSPEALNSKYSRELLPTEETLEKLNRDVNEATLHTPLYLPKDYLLNHIKCKVVDGYEYDPVNAKMNYVTGLDGIERVNTYQPTFCAPDKGKKSEAEDKWWEHMGNLIAEREYQEILTHVIAYQVQNPGVKIRWCPLIQGGEGCGKTVLYPILESVIGHTNIGNVNNDSIRSQWNDWAIGRQVVVIPEVFVSGPMRTETMNRLKEVLTDDVITINQRNRTSRKERNRSNYFMMTNHHDAVAVMKGSRRYFVVKSPLQTEEHVRALGEGYFDSLFRVIHECGGGFRSFFEEWSIPTSFDPNGRAPGTKYLDEMIEDSADPETAYFRYLIREGDHPLIQEDLVGSTRLRLLMTQARLKDTPRSVATMLRMENYEPISEKDRGVMIDGVREHLWVKAGHLLTEKDIPGLARTRQETNYKAPQEDEWI